MDISDVKILLSEESEKIFKDALEQMRILNFDCVNSPVFISTLLEDDESLLLEYLKKQGIKEDDIDEAIEDILFEKHVDLVLPEDDENVNETEGSSESYEEDEKEYQRIKNAKLKSIKYSELNLVAESGNEYNIPVSKEIYDVWACIYTNCIENGIKKVTQLHILYAFFKTRDYELRAFLEENLDINYRKARRLFTNDLVFKNVAIPYELSYFLSNVNEKVDQTTECEILMRDKEVEQIWNISMKKTKRNTVIIGDPGVGKTAIIEKMVYDIVTGRCPSRFKDFSVLNLDINSLIAGTTYRGDAEERIRLLINFLESKDNVILFVDEVHTMLGAGSCFEGEMDLANALKPILARGDTIVIGATTNEEYEKYFKKDGALSRRFEPVIVEEPKAKDVYKMIENKVSALGKFHNVSISKDIVEFAIMIANCFAFERKNPDKTLDLIDRSMAVAEINGKKVVDKDCILKNFEFYMEKFKLMDDNQKRLVAYHEAGHYIVGKATGHFDILAVSILPAENYLGVNVYEQDRYKVTSSKQYFIDSIAFNLAGKVAEEMHSFEHYGGISSDLTEATKIAYEAVVKNDMGETEHNMIFLNSDDYPILSEDRKNSYEEEIKKIIQKGYERAKKILEAHKDELELIVQELLKKYILSDSQIQFIIMHSHLK